MLAANERRCSRASGSPGGAPRRQTVVVAALQARVPLQALEEEEVILVAVWAMIVALLAVAVEARIMLVVIKAIPLGTIVGTVL